MRHIRWFCRRWREEFVFLVHLAARVDPHLRLGLQLQDSRRSWLTDVEE